MKDTITIYASNADIDPGMELSVTLEDVDVKQVVAEFNVTDILNSLDFDEIANYYIERSKDN